MPTKREQWYEYISKKYPNNPEFSVTDMEQDSSHAPLAKKETEGLIGRCNITVTSYLKRDRDPDATSFKYCLDSIVDASILGNDTPEFIEEIRHRQVKTKGDEWTEIIIEEVG